jgi:hypothetical protein
MEIVNPKESVLFFSAQLPSKYVPIGGQKIAWNHLENYIKEGSPIHLFCFKNKIENQYFDPNEHSFCASNHIYELNKFEKIWNHVKRFWLPTKVSGRYKRSIFKKLIIIIDSYNISTVHFEFTSSLHYAVRLKKTRPTINIEFVEHDVTYQSLYRISQKGNFFKRLIFRFEYLRTKQYEIKSLRLLDNVFVLNEKDAQILNFELKHSVKVLYPKVESWITATRRDQIENYSMIFVGALHRLENQEGIIWFIENVLGLVLNKFPKAKLFIIGGGAPNSLLDKANANILFTGFVENLKPYFEMAHVAISPLNIGAGIKIKTIETVSARIPTIATEIGAEGVNKSDFLILANTSNDFAYQINKIFERNEK